MKTFDILLSCMHQDLDSILAKSNIRCGALVINQCDRSFVVEKGNVRCIHTKERGLSRSRNMAIANSKSHICLLADDDEIFNDDVRQTVCAAFDENPTASVIMFNVRNANGKIYNRKTRINHVTALSTTSCRIAFRRNDIVDHGIKFDEQMGSGTGHGACEEVKFLYDCMREGLQVVAVPYEVAKKEENATSQWFKGYTGDYFYWQGWATHRFMPAPAAMIYAFYTAVRKHSKYKSTISFNKALTNMLKGILSH